MLIGFAPKKASSFRLSYLASSQAFSDGTFNTFRLILNLKMFFPKNDPDSQFYEIHKEDFGYDNDFLLIIIKHDPLFNPEFLAKAKQFEDSLSNLKYITRVSSPLSQQHLINTPTGLLSFPLLHFDDPQALVSDSIRIFSSPIYRNFFWHQWKIPVDSCKSLPFQRSAKQVRYW